MDGMDTETAHDAATHTATVEPVQPIATEQPRTLTIREAAELCGITRTAMRGRVERGSVQSVLRHGIRKIPLSELQRVGLLGRDGVAVDGMGVGGVGDVHAGHVGLQGMGDLLAMLERLQAENVAAVERAVAAETRLQLEPVLTTELQTELHAARARVQQLELQLADAQRGRRRWFGLARRSS